MQLAAAMEDSDYIRLVDETKLTVLQYAQEDWPLLKQSVCGKIKDRLKTLIIAFSH